MMTRNLRRRVEIACPVQDAELRWQIRRIIETELQDNVKASSMLSDGTYRRKTGNGVPVDSQVVFMENSLHREIQDTDTAEADSVFPRHGLGETLRRLFSQKKNRNVQ